MIERDEERLSTADMAAAPHGATMERDRAVEDRSADRAGSSGIEIRRGGGTADRAKEDDFAPLFAEQEGGELRSRWEQIQTGFVDEPREAVERADELVAAVMKRLANIFADERSQLESQWTQGDDVSTEDLRIALRRYRSFFDRLLSI